MSLPITHPSGTHAHAHSFERRQCLPVAVGPSDEDLIQFRLTAWSDLGAWSGHCCCWRIQIFIRVYCVGRARWTSNVKITGSENARTQTECFLKKCQHDRRGRMKWQSRQNEMTDEAAGAGSNTINQKWKPRGAAIPAALSTFCNRVKMQSKKNSPRAGLTVDSSEIWTCLCWPDYSPYFLYLTKSYQKRKPLFPCFFLSK